MQQKLTSDTTNKVFSLCLSPAALPPAEPTHICKSEQ